MERFETLLSAYFDGALNESEAEELVRLLVEEPDRRHLFLELSQEHRLLSAVLSPSNEREFSENVIRQLRRDEQHFVGQVLDEIRNENGAFQATARIASPDRRPSQPPCRERLARPFWRRMTHRPAQVVLAACFALIMGVCSFLWSRTEAAGAGILRASSDVVVQRGKRQIPAGQVAGLHAGDIVKTKRGSTAVIQYDKEATLVELKENTELQMAKAKHGKRLALRLGQIEASVAPQPAARPMVIETAQAEAKVVGTQFTVAARPNSTWLGVREGTVELKQTDNARVPVEAGQFAVAAPGLPLLSRAGTIPPDGMIPVKFQLFSEYQPEDSAWRINPDGVIRQTRAGNAANYFKFQPFRGSFVVEVIAVIDEVGSDGNVWGVGLGLATKDPVLQKAQPVYLFQSAQHEERGSLFLLKADSAPPRQMAFSHPPHGACHLKLRADPLENQSIQLKGKIWVSGTPEPADWMIASDSIALKRPLDHIVLSTTKMAATFTDLRLSFAD